jgi:hypothetical protein
VQDQLSRRSFGLGVAAVTAGVAAFLIAQIHAWPPHEDETLALFVGSRPLGEMLDIVLGQRGGAPLHFLLVHVATWFSESLTAVRAISVVFAVASIPVVGLVLARLAGRRAALMATIVVAASWVTLFHGIYGRMYSLFLFTSALSFLALLRALERRRPLDWSLWGLAVLAVLACHQYGAFVLAIQIAYVAAIRTRERFSVLPPLLTVLAIAAVALPLWRSNLVLASRFDVGVGEGGTTLGGPYPVLEYLRTALGDFVGGWVAVFAIVCALAVFGWVTLLRQRPRSALLAALVVVVPTVGLMLARVGGSANAPETRHLIFVLPFFALAVGVGVAELARATGRRAPAVLAAAAVALVAIEIAWGWTLTPTLYRGEPEQRSEARQAAATWLAATSRPTDVMFGYDPLYLEAEERGAELGDVFVPRADPKLALDVLRSAPKPLGRGVWVLDASDGNRIKNSFSRLVAIENRSPGPGFETRAFGSFLVVRTVKPTVTIDRFLEATLAVQRMGYELSVTTAGLNYRTARAAIDALGPAE